ncbi:MAG TPA: hypothetical protein VFB90_07825, partial [Dehalococcoidia bacterium]|nr:hypothetical protein [Dehalococcoidia bacterium]
GAIGWADRLFFSGVSSQELDIRRLEVLLKGASLLFGFGCSILIYLILRKLHLKQRDALVGGALLMFNPAMWFNVSIWGETETISLFFVLLSIWLAERDSPFGAWLSLGVAVLTRPQMSIPALLLGCVYLRKFRPSHNLRGISWGVIGLFLLISPLLLALSPSLPVDVLRANFALRVTPDVGGYVTAKVASDGYSFWPLVTGLLEGQSGLSRFAFPSTAPLIAGHTYAGVSALLSIGLPVIMAGYLLVRRKATEEGRYLVVVSLAMLTWLMFTTSSSSHYFLYALALVIVSRKWLTSLGYYGMTFVLTITTLVTQYGSLGRHIRNVPDLMPLLHASNNGLTRGVMALYSSDWFITVGILANLAAVLWLALEALWTGRQTEPRERQAPEPRQAERENWPLGQPQDATS